MGVTVTINDIDRSHYVYASEGRLNLSWSLGNRPRGLLPIIDKLGTAYRPPTGASVAIFQNGVRVFGGTIERVAETCHGQSPLLTFDCDLVGYEQRYDKRLIIDRVYGGSFHRSSGSTLENASHGLTNNLPIRLATTDTLPAPLTPATTYWVVNATADTFQLSTTMGGGAITLTTDGTGAHRFLWFAGRIIKDVITNVVPGEIGGSSHQIQDGAAVEKIVCDHVYCTELFTLLAELSGLIWYIDAEQNFYFVPRTFSTAPLSVSDTTAKIHSLSAQTTREEVRNREYIRVAWEAFGVSEGVFVGNSSQRVFVLDHKAARVDQITLDGVNVSFGLWGVDTDRDFYWSAGERSIYQDLAGDVLTPSNTLTVFYRELGTDVVSYGDESAVTARAAVEGGSGAYEHFQDNTHSRDAVGALTRANASVEALKTNGAIAEFETEILGVQPGQLITINRTRPQMSGTWLIQEVSASYTGSVSTADPLSRFRFRCQAVDGTRLPLWSELWRQFADTGSGVSVGGAVAQSASPDAAPGDVTLGTVRGPFYLPPDAYGIVKVRYTIAYEPPSPLGTFDRVYLYLQVYDDAARPATGDIGGFVVPPRLVFTADPGTDVLSCTGHPLVDGIAVMLANSGGSLPGGTNDFTTYYVRDTTANSFKLALTLGGSALNITDAGTGEHRVIWGETSFLVPTVEPVALSVVRYDPNAKILTVTYPSPQERQYWRVYAVSGSALVQNLLVRSDKPNPTPNTVLVVDPPPAHTHGAEFAPIAASFTLVSGPDYYPADGGRWLWYARVAWTPPTADPRSGQVGGFDLVVQYESDLREIDASLSPNGLEHTTLDRPVGFSRENVVLWLVTYDTRSPSNRNTIVPGVTPSIVLTIERPIGTVGQEYAPVITGMTAEAEYVVSGGSGQVMLVIRTSYTAPFDSRFGGVQAWARSPELTAPGNQLTGIEPIPGGVLAPDTIGTTYSVLTVFPPVTEDWDIYLLSADTSNRVNTYNASVTPKVTISVPASSVGAALPNVTGFSVAYAYTSGDYYGRKVLELTPTFTLPSGQQASFMEFWAKREDGKWYHLGDPAESGANGRAIVNELPEVTFTWQFLAIVNDINNKDLDGNADSNPASPPAGTPTFSLSIPPPTGLLDGDRVELTGRIGTAELHAGEILVGQGGGKPTRFTVIDGASSMIGFWGYDASIPFTGLFTKILRVASAITGDVPRIEADGSGVSIVNVPIQVNAGSYTHFITSLGVRTMVDSNNYVANDGATYFCRNGGNVKAYLSVSTGAGEVGLIEPSSGNLTRLNANGILYLSATSPEVQMNTLRVLSTRKTGWSTATGTASRSSFDTASVTTEQLAQRVKALLDDLHSSSGGHGLIGS